MIVTSQLADERLSSEALIVVCDDVLAKPFDLTRLSAHSVCRVYTGKITSQGELAAQDLKRSRLVLGRPSATAPAMQSLAPSKTAAAAILFFLGLAMRRKQKRRVTCGW